MKVTVTYEDNQGTNISVTRCLETNVAHLKEIGGRDVRKIFHAQGDMDGMPDVITSVEMAQSELIRVASERALMALGFAGAQVNLSDSGE